MFGDDTLFLQRFLTFAGFEPGPADGLFGVRTVSYTHLLREERIGEAVKLGRIGHDHAISLLPGPSATSIEQVAGLLEGPDATPDQQRVSRQLRGLLEIIRAGGSDAEDRRREEREARQARESAEREKALAALESRGIKPGSAGTDEAAA